MLYKLLVVDDDMMFMDSLVKHMAWDRLSIKVVGIAYDGMEAWKVCKSQKLDIVLTDVKMPRMDGTELAVKIREEMPDCQIVFMSSYSDKKYLKTAIRVRAIDYIEKPVDRQELEEVLLRSINLIKQEHSVKLNGMRCYSRTIEDIIYYIEQHYSEDITIEFLASHVYLTPNYLCSLFKKETGKTINQYITEVRIAKAREMLTNTYKSLTEIANAVGYSDPRYFSKLFQKIMGKTPSVYRRWGLDETFPQQNY